MLDINTIKLSELPELEEAFNRDARNQKFSDLENKWITYKNHDMDEDEYEDFIDPSQSNWEDYFYSEEHWVNPSYEDKDPSTIQSQLGGKCIGDDNHYILIFYDKETNEVVCWSMDID